MKTILSLGAIIIILVIAVVLIKPQKKAELPPPSTPNATSSASLDPKNLPDFTDIAINLDTPWGLVFLPDNSMLVTEREGKILRIDKNHKLDETFNEKLMNVVEIGEGGLLGIALHPQFSQNRFVYLYYTYNSKGDDTLNRVVRMTYTENRLVNEEIILDKIPGAVNHNGGRIKFGPDNYLYVGTGDAQEPSQAQDTKTLGGKILRITDEGAPAPGNPFGNEVYTYGHRNVQGLAWDNLGRLWATEHGRSGIETGFDEVNLIEKGKNYGWPVIEGDETKPGMQRPVRHSGATIVWAPSGMAYLNDSLYFGGLKGQALYKVPFKDNAVIAVIEYVSGKFGRLRDVVAGPDGMLYVTTSNRDGRGTPNATDDKIIRVNPQKL